MIDSCKLRNVFPGLAHRYSNPIVLITSTIKSEPGRSTVITSIFEGSAVFKSRYTCGNGALAFFVRADGDACVAISVAWAVRGFAAIGRGAAPADGPLRNWRKSTQCFT